MKTNYWASSKAEEAIGTILERADSAIGENYRNILELNRNMYYDYDKFHDSETSIARTGTQGEFLKLSCKQSRNLIRNMVTLVASDRLAFEVIAMASDEAVYSSTKVARSIIQDIIARKNVDRLQDEAVEMSLVYGSSFYVARWNTALGEPYVNDESGSPLFTGDIDISVKSPMEVLFDTTASSWDEVDWVVIKQKRNKYTVASQYKKFASKIEDIVDSYVNSDACEEKNEDNITVYEFYHKPTPAMPDGRLLVFIDDEIVLFDKPNPYKDIPVIPCIPMGIGQTLKGYALFSDLLPLQEMFDNEMSTISNNHAAFGLQNVLIPKDSNIEIDDLKGLRVINYEGLDNGGIKPLQLASTSPELFKMLEVCKQNMMELSGINATVRGNPPASLSSGIAIATLSANALKFASSFSKANQIALERLMELVLKEFKVFATTERTIAILGANKSYINMRFTGASIEEISHIKIRPTNPMADTAAGRMEIANAMVNSGFVKNKQDFLKVVATGDLDVLEDEAMSEDELIAAENEQLREGKSVPILMLDNHVIHLSKHKMLLNNPIIRSDSTITPVILAHIQEHLEMLESGDPAVLQLAMTDTISPESIQKPQQQAPQGAPLPPMEEAVAGPTEQVAEPAPLVTPLNQGVM